METEKRCLGLILGCAVGDAKGIPVENKTKQEIEEYFKTHSKKELYLKCEDHPFITDSFEPGSWTDDTQLTLAMCRSFIKSKCFNMDSIVEEHCFEYKRSLDGWGGTRNAIKRLVDKTHSYKDCGNFAIGNGVLMKISPLAFYYSKQSDISWKEKQKSIEILSKMTHTTPVAIITACLLCYFEEEIFRNPKILKSKKEMKELLKKTIEKSIELEFIYIKEEKDDLAFQKSTTKLKLLLDNFENLNDEKIIEISDGATYYCLNSMIAVIGLLCSCDCSFKDIERSIYLGGDTDSNASMIGAIYI
eukprot:gene2463-3173_t